MNTYKVTITSKNQITLPAKLVRKFGLDKGQRLEVSDTGKTIELKVEPSFEEAMKPIWDKIAKQRGNKPPATNEELSRAAREIWESGKVEYR